MASAALVHAEPITPEQAAFFESKVRPVLAEHCYACHATKKQNNGLRLDARELILKGSDYGLVVTPGNVETSKLIHAIRHDQPGQVEAMPKDAPKLDAASIEAISEWIRQGLPWPEEPVPAAMDLHRSAKDHWAFQPVVAPPVPTVKAKDLVYQPMDAFVLHQLEENGLSFAPKVDRATRMRRVHIDLLGFPPAFEEVQAFVNDKEPNAYIRLVDRLLESPHFGERWGRYWLDLARFADTKGYVFQEERRYPYSYTYRDWVIRALNADMPYDQFLQQQVAADQIESPAKTENQAALGFLTLGRRFLNNESDIIDDRLDVIFRTTQGLTIGCARCHDHKFDPIPTADYYGLYGVLASSTEPKDLPALGGVDRTPELVKFEAELAGKETEVVNYRDERVAELFKEPMIEKYLLATTEGKDPDVRKWTREQGLYFNAFEAWQAMIEKGEENVFGIWRAMASKPDDKFATELAEHLKKSPAAPALIKAVQEAAVTNKAGLAKVYAQLFAQAAADKPELAMFHAALQPPLGLRRIQPADTEQYFLRPDKERLRELRSNCENFKATSPAAPPRAMAMVDKPQPVEPRVFVRGNPGRQGDLVPRQFLKILSGPDRKPFQKGSGRLELAQQLSGRDNPLTARVFANRAWAHLFGEPLVATPSDFGVRTLPPANPALLEHLSASFMQQNWSMKKLLREILLSSTYQQQSQWREDAAAKDPENRWFWRMNRKRLDFEALRDSLLVVSGTADLKMFGKPEEIFTAPWSKRRSIYGFIDRQNLPGTFRTFDFASPDAHSPIRFETTVPQQALYMLNSPFVQELAGALLASVSAGSPPADRARGLIRRVLSREPTDAEIQSALAYVQPAEPDKQADRIWVYGYGGWDAATHKASFTSFQNFVRHSWCGDAGAPDPKTGWALVGPEFGHPGHTHELASIRRWKVQTAATVSLSGKVVLADKQSDGLKVYIVSSRSGLLGEWSVPPAGEVETMVPSVAIAPGDILDFIVDCGENNGFDSYLWNPAVRDAGSKALIAESLKDFLGPPPERWTSLAQALLCANEFVFVD